MRGENTVFEEVFRTDLGLVEANSQNDLREFAMNLDGDNVVNAHEIMNFGYMMSFRLEQEIVYGDLIVHYIDEDGNKLTEDNILEMNMTISRMASHASAIISSVTNSMVRLPAHMLAGYCI